jgi:hypothetical protein
LIRWAIVVFNANTLRLSFHAFSTDIESDLDGNGSIDFGEKLPDANVLKGSVDLFDSYVNELDSLGCCWPPGTMNMEMPE